MNQFTKEQMLAAISNNGLEAEHIVTGFKGVVVGVAFHSSGCVAYTVLPKCKEGENVQPDAHDFTGAVLLFGKRVLNEEPRTLSEIQLDERVCNSITGVEGVAQAVYYPYGSATQIAMQPVHTDRDGNGVKATWPHECDIIRVGAQKTTPVKPEKPGGPGHTPSMPGKQ
jgi:hypothetical protein